MTWRWLCVGLLWWVFPAEGDDTYSFVENRRGRGAVGVDGYGSARTPLKHSYLHGALGDGHHVEISLNATLSHNTFDPGQELRVKIDLTFLDTTFQTANESDTTYATPMNATVTCFNGTTSMQNVSSLVEEIEVNSGLSVKSVFFMNITSGEYGACLFAKENVTVVDHVSYAMHSRSKLRGAVTEYLKFNVSEEQNGLELVVYPHVPAGTVNGEQTVGSSCGNFPVNTTYYYHTKAFGVSSYNEEERSGSFLSTSIFATFVAPRFPFFMCFRRYEFDQRNMVNTSEEHAWLPLFTEFGETVFQANVTGDFLYYSLPERTLSAEEQIGIKIFNFGYSRGVTLSSDGYTDLATLSHDNAKLVPQGLPCTFESLQHNYYGTEFVSGTGIWDTTAKGGIFEGAYQGSVGVFGSETQNPLNGDPYTSATSPYLFSNVQINDTVVQQTVLYVQLPPEGVYDICMSLVSDRVDAKLNEKQNFSTPVWRKLRRCPGSNQTDANPDCHMTIFDRQLGASMSNDEVADLFAYEARDLSLTISPAQWGWSAMDITPGSWGHLRIDTGGDTASITPHPSTRYQGFDQNNYYQTKGGDQLRLVPADRFTEQRGSYFPDLGETFVDDVALRAYDTTYNRATTGRQMFQKRATGAPYGSYPEVGCWHNLDDRYAEFGSAFPTASLSIRGDPTGKVVWDDVPNDAGYVVRTVAKSFSATMSLRMEIRQRYMKMTVVGPSDSWFGLLLPLSSGGLASGAGYALVFTPETTTRRYNVREYSVTNFTTATLLSSTVTVLGVGVPDGVSSTLRTVTIERSVFGKSADYFSFSDAEMTVLANQGSSAAFSGFENSTAVVLTSSVSTQTGNATASEGFAALYFPNTNLGRSTLGTFHPDNATEYYVCYRPVGTSGWKRLAFRGLTDSLIPTKWGATQASTTGLTKDNYKHSRKLVPGFYSLNSLQKYQNSTCGWESNVTTALSSTSINVWCSDPILDTIRNDYHRAYDDTSRVAASEGWAMRVVAEHIPCEGLDTAGLETTYGAYSASPEYYEALDPGVQECTLAELLDTTSTTDCSGPAHEDRTLTTSVHFFLRIPQTHAAGYRICLRHGALNWMSLSHNTSVEDTAPFPFNGGMQMTTENLLYPTAPSRMGLQFSGRLVGGSSTAFVFHDALSGLNIQTDGEGDWFWLVAVDRVCSPVRLATTTAASGNYAHFTKRMAVLHLQQYCDFQYYFESYNETDAAAYFGAINSTYGGPFFPRYYPSIAFSQRFHADCLQDSIVQGHFCENANCTTERSVLRLRRLASRNPFPWSSMVPRNLARSHTTLSAVAGTLAVPGVYSYHESGAEAHPFNGKLAPYHPELKICYKPSGQNWVELPLPKGRNRVEEMAEQQNLAFDNKVLLKVVNNATDLLLPTKNFTAALAGAKLVGTTGELTTVVLFDENKNNLGVAYTENPLRAMLGGAVLKLVSVEPPLGTEVSPGATFFEKYVYSEKKHTPYSVAFTGGKVVNSVDVHLTHYENGETDLRITFNAMQNAQVNKFFAVALTPSPSATSAHYLVLVRNTSVTATDAAAQYTLTEESIDSKAQTRTTLAASSQLMKVLTHTSTLPATSSVTFTLRLQAAVSTFVYTPAAALTVRVMEGAVAAFAPFVTSNAETTAENVVRMETTMESKWHAHFLFIPFVKNEKLPARGVTLDVHINARTERATIEVEGPADTWFAVGFGHEEMKNTYAVVVYPNSVLGKGQDVVEEWSLGEHVFGTKLSSKMVFLVADETVGSRRKVTLTRAMTGATTQHFSFSFFGDVEFITAVGTSEIFGSHGLAYRAHGKMTPKYFELGAAHNMNAPCATPADGTQGSPYISSTDVFTFHEHTYDSSFIYAKASLVTPHARGTYAVCLMTNSSGASFRKIGEQTIVDNEARYSVANAAAKVNQGALELEVRRCKPTGAVADNVCSTDGSRENVDLSPTGDGLKLLPVVTTDGRDTACHDGTNDNFAYTFGLSEHLGLDLHTGSYIHDLGPTDTLSKKGTVTTTLPAVQDDVSVEYKVCLLTTRNGVKRWFEVASVAERLQTVPAGVGAFVLNTFLQTAESSLHTAPSETSGLAVLGGASSKYWNGTTAAVVHGFTFKSAGDGVDLSRYANATLKWVVRKAHDGTAWVAVSHATCALPPESPLVYLEHNSSSGELYANFHIPMQSPISSQAREYMLCVEVSAGIWVQLVSSTLFDSFSHAARFFPEHDALKASGVTVVANPVGFVMGVKKVSVYDLGDGPSLCDIASDGCADFYAVVEDTGLHTPCPDTDSASYKMLAHVSKFSSTATFATELGADAKYKVCMFNNATASTALRKKGVAYQLWNNGDVAEGGQSGYYFTSELNSLKVVPVGVVWNKTDTILVCDEPLCVLPAARSHTHFGHTVTTRSHVIQEDDLLTLQVSLAAGGSTAGVGSFAIHLEYCQEPDDPDCVLSNTQNTNLFSVENMDRGTCATSRSSFYGWPADGTTQPLVEGAITYNLRFTTPCPASKLQLGCGFRFVGSLPNKDYTAVTTLKSPPIWVTVFPKLPVGVLVDGVYVSHSSVARFECISFRECAAFSFFPARLGSRVLAPHGDWSATLAHSKLELRDLASSAAGVWPVGAVVLPYLPSLMDNLDTAVIDVLLSLRYHGEAAETLVKWRITIVRPVILKLEVLHLAPQWTGPTTGRSDITPQPSWSARLWSGETVASEGSYVTALHPYELGVVMHDKLGPLPAEALMHTVVHLKLQANGSSAVLADIPTAANSIIEANTSMPPEQLGITSAHYMKDKTSHKVVSAYAMPGTQVGIAAVPFRIRSPLGCSRYGVQPTNMNYSNPWKVVPLALRTLPPYANASAKGLVGHGCVVALSVDNRNSPVVARTTLRTPVRGVADALNVEVLRSPHNNSTNITRTPRRGTHISTTATEGITLWVQAVNLYGGFVDEFHVGSVVVQFDTTDSLRHTDGTFGVNGVSLVQTTFPFRFYPGKGWGARFTLRTTGACNSCAFSLHSTAGAAGGVAFYNDPLTGKIAAYGGLLANVTFTSNATATPQGNTTMHTTNTASPHAADPFLRIRSVSGDNGKVVGSGPTTFNNLTSAVEYVVHWVVDGSVDPFNYLGFVVETWERDADVPFTSPRNFTLRMPGTLGLISTQTLGAKPTLPLNPDDATILNGASNGGILVDVEGKMWSNGWKGEVKLAKGQDRLCRDCRFEICSTVDDPALGTVLSRDLDRPCIAIRLFITLPETAVPSVSRSLDLLEASFSTGSADFLYVCETLVTFRVLPTIGLKPTPDAPAEVKTIAYDTHFAFGIFQRGQEFKKVVFPVAQNLTNQTVRLTDSRTAVTITVTATTAGIEASETGSEVFIVSLDSFQPYISPTKFRWGYLSQSPDQLVVPDAALGEFSCTATPATYAFRRGSYVRFQENPGVGSQYAASPLQVGAPALFSAFIASAGGAIVRNYPSSTVMVTSTASGGCGDGGMELLMIGQGGTREGLLHETAFTKVNNTVAPNAHLITSKSGQVSFWVNYSAPCESCALTIQLCYAHATVTALNCLIPRDHSDTVTDRLPVLGKRSVVTKLFTVAPMSTEGVSIVSQNLQDAKVARGELYVGDNMRVSVRLTRSLHGWLYNTVGAADVLLQIRQRPGTPTEGASTLQRDSEVVKYAYGGFLGHTANIEQKRFAPHWQTKCHYQTHPQFRLDLDRPAATGAREYRLGLRARVESASLGGEGTEIHFHFTRPCAMCEVWVTVSPALGYSEFPVSTLPLLSTPASATSEGTRLCVTVKTCSVAWTYRGLQVPHGYKRRPFALVVSSVDTLGFPSWGETGQDTAGSSTYLNMSNLLGSGGGGGGDLRVTNMALSSSPERTVSGCTHDGSTIYRMEFARTCTVCSIPLQFQNTIDGPAMLRHNMTIITDTHTFTMVPLKIKGERVIRTKGEVHTLPTHLYAADKDGERSYAMGGPSLLSWQRQFFPVFKPPWVSLNLTKAVKKSAAVQISAVATRNLTVVRGDATLSHAPLLAQDGLLRSYVPLDPLKPLGDMYIMNHADLLFSGSPGGLMTQYMFATTPAGRYPIHLEAGIAASGEQPALFTAPPPEVLAVISPNGTRVHVVTSDTWFEVVVWGVGRDVHSDPLLWGGRAFKSTNATGSVWVEKCNTMFELDGIGEQRGRPFAYGAATLRLRAYSGHGPCELTFRHSHSVYRSAKLTVDVVPFGSTLFHWRSSKTVAVHATIRDDNTTDVDNTTLQYTTGYTTKGEKHAEVELYAADPDLKINELFASDRLGTMAVVVDPPGCFHATNNGTPAVASGAVTFTGHFSEEHGLCTFTDVVNLPYGTVLTSELRVLTEDPDHVDLVHYRSPFGVHNFGGLKRLTKEGLPAVGTSEGMVVQLHIMGMAHSLVNGTNTVENTTNATMYNIAVHDIEVTVRGLYPTRPFATYVNASDFVVDRALQTYRWLPARPTRNLTATGHDGEHNPPVFEVTAVNRDRIPLFSVTLGSVGPVFVVVTATRLQVDMVFKLGDGKEVLVPLVHGGSERILMGQYLDIVVHAVDEHGNVAVVAGEGLGADLVLQLSFSSSALCSGSDLPDNSACVSVPRFYTAMTCELHAPPTCSDPSWTFEHAHSPRLNIHANNPYTRKLSRGAAVFTNAMRHPKANLHSNLEALTLSANGGSDWTGRGVHEFHISLRIESLQAIVIEGVACKFFSGEAVCDFPDTFRRLQPEGVGATDLPLIERLMKIPRVWISSAHSRSVFSLAVQLTTTGGLLERSGHSIKLSAVCVVPATNTKSPVYDTVPLLGVWDTAQSKVLPAEGWAVPVVGGQAVFDGLAFAKPCRKARIVFSCAMDPLLDPHNTCNGMSMSTEFIDAMEPIVLIPTPVPKRTKVDYPVVSLVMGLMSSSFTDLMKKTSFSKMESLLADSLQERTLCRSNQDNTTAFVERNSCDQKLPNGETNPNCACKSVGIPGATAGTVRADWLCLLTSVETELGMTDAYKSQYAKCRQNNRILSTAESDALDRHPHILQAHAGMFPVVEFEIRLGDPGSVVSAQDITAKAQEALLDYDTPMYAELRIFYSKMLLPKIFTSVIEPTPAPTPEPIVITATVTLPVQEEQLSSAVALLPFYGLTLLVLIPML